MKYTVIVFEPVFAPKADVQGGELEFGCFDEDDYFDPSPLEGI